MLAVLTFLVVCYTVFIALAIFGWLKLKEPKAPENYQPVTFISVLIPVRNEAGNILKLLNDLLVQSYPKTLFEVILIDDHSEDGTVNWQSNSIGRILVLI
jgi:biofilm PGA synthesis N-glycosyltransferase PgaC